jgi:ornithine carbamoyltransferase
MFLSSNDIQLGRGEPIKDTARVLGRMIHGAIIRTFAQKDVEEFAEYSKIPTINALTDDEHPCQILTDIFTFEETRGSIKGKVVTFVGDAACNVPVSWIFAAAKLGFELRLAAPKKYQPAPAVLALGRDPSVTVTGLVPDTRPFLQHARVVVAPLRVARGIQNKVLEGMAMSRPVVVTAAAAEGIQATHGIELEVAADAAQFAAKSLALMDDDARSRRMGEVARERVIAAYSWSANLLPIAALLEGELAAQRAAAG